MSMHYLRYLKLAVLCGGLVLWTGQSLNQARADTSCTAIASAREVLSCALERHPDIRKTRLESSQAQQLESVAQQRPNPELDGKVGAISLTDGAPLTTEVSLMHTFELGGKRGSRIDRARAELKQVGATVRRVEEEVSTRVLLSLHRLRQVEEELVILSETIETFRKQAHLLKSRPSLTPEQDVSFSIFTLATEDTELKRNLLETEKLSLIRSLQIALDSSVTYSKAWLPEEPGNWPDVSANGSLSSDTSRLRLGQSEIDLAQADLQVAKSIAWPDLKLGPFLESESASGVRSSALGLQLSFPLPVFHQNTGGKTYSEAGVLRAEASFRVSADALKRENEKEIAVYQSTVSQLKQSRWHQEYERRHKSVESFFKRGVLSSPMVIEAHRQIIEVQKTSHELELRALEAFYQIKVLSGSLPEANL